MRLRECPGLLGANGAGKTTTIKMLCGLLEASTGSMQLAGERGAFRSTEIRQQIGYMSQTNFRFTTILYNQAEFTESPRNSSNEKRRWVLEFSGLEGKEQQITRSLPGGWKQRVAFGSAIMHEPGIVFLDEPTSGVDPLARRAFWMMINRLADAGTTILVATHYLEEAEPLGFMVAGELLVETPKRNQSAARPLAGIPRGPAATRAPSFEIGNAALAGCAVRRRLHVVHGQGR